MPAVRPALRRTVVGRPGLCEAMPSAPARCEDARAPPSRTQPGGSFALVEVDGIDQTRLPAHIAVVMDGNGRWAQKRGLARTEGHRAGEDALFDVVDGALELGIKWLTVYAFSTENWKRPTEEVRFLINFNESILLRR